MKNAKLEIFKTLEFKGVEKKTIGKHAHPIEIEKDKYEWGGSSIPLLMTTGTTVKKLKQLYKGLDFDLVNLVIKKLIDLPTNGA
jgi:hypothetical protein